VKRRRDRGVNQIAEKVRRQLRIVLRDLSLLDAALKCFAMTAMQASISPFRFGVLRTFSLIQSRTKFDGFSAIADPVSAYILVQ